MGNLRWKNFKVDTARAEKHIDDLTGCRSLDVFESLYDLCYIENAAEHLQQRNSGLEHSNNRYLYEVYSTEVYSGVV